MRALEDMWCAFHVFNINAFWRFLHRHGKILSSAIITRR